MSFHKAVFSHEQAKVVVKFNGLLLLLLLPLHHSTITTKKVKVKFSQEQATKSQTVNGDIALLFL